MVHVSCDLHYRERRIFGKEGGMKRMESLEASGFVPTQSNIVHLGKHKNTSVKIEVLRNCINIQKNENN
jgi:hypothetical protein